MPLLSLSRLDFDFGRETLLRDVTLDLEPGEKAALVGINGSGKSTLLQIVAGSVTPDSGERHLTRRARIVLLPQETAAEGDETLLEWVQGAHELEAVRLQIDALHARLDAGETLLPAEMEGYGDLQHRFEMLGGYAHVATVEATLHGAGVRGRRLHQADPGAVGRRTPARGARGDIVAEWRPGAARRAHQPPRSRCARVAARLRAAEPERDALGVARSLFPRSRHHDDVAPVESQRDALAGQLLGVRRRRARIGGSTGGDVPAPARGDQAHRGLHPPQHRRPEDQDGEGPAQDARPVGTHREAARGAHEVQAEAADREARWQRGAAGGAGSARRTGIASCSRTSTWISRAATRSASSARTAPARRRCSRSWRGN